jgi:hypothetical protein
MKFSIHEYELLTTLNRSLQLSSAPTPAAAHSRTEFAEFWLTPHYASDSAAELIIQGVIVMCPFVRMVDSPLQAAYHA